MIKNKIQTILDERGLKPVWLEDEYNRRFKVKITRQRLADLRHNHREIRVLEIFNIAKIFDINAFDLVKKELNLSKQKVNKL